MALRVTSSRANLQLAVNTSPIPRLAFDSGRLVSLKTAAHEHSRNTLYCTRRHGEYYAAPHLKRKLWKAKFFILCDAVYICWGCRGTLKLVTLGSERINIFTPRSDQLQISPAASSEIEHHTVWRNLAFDSLLIWKVIILPILTISLIYNSLSNVGRVYFLNLGVKGLNSRQKNGLVEVCSGRSKLRKTLRSTLPQIVWSAATRTAIRESVLRQALGVNRNRNHN